jgi:SagB-type dehydrogenase family enzyme
VLPVDDMDSLPMLYHLNSAPRPRPIGWQDPPYEFHYKQVAPLAESIALPTMPPAALGELQRRRRSCRAFAAREMALAELSVVLGSTYASTGSVASVGELSFLPRTVPSAGGLYPLELYSCVQRVAGLADGLYHYDVRAHRLEPLRSGALTGELCDALLDQHFVRDANVVLVISAVFGRTLEKYGARGYRYVLFEAGHVAQNACLVASERGLASVCLGGFADARLNRFLEVDGRSEAALYCVALGYAASEGGEQA